MSSQGDSSLEDILREYSELPEYSEMPIPTVKTISLFGNCPISIAATRGLIVEISILLKNGADIDVRGEHGYTPLHEAVAQGHFEAVKFLIDSGANIALKNANGDTPAEIAKLLDEKDIYRYLNQSVASS